MFATKFGRFVIFLWEIPNAYPLPSGNFGGIEKRNKDKIMICSKVIRICVEFDINTFISAHYDIPIHKSYIFRKPQLPQTLLDNHEP